MPDNHAYTNTQAWMDTILEYSRALDPETWERLDELETERRPFSAGWNMPGYMPDNEPSTFETFDDALEFIRAELDDVLDGCAPDQKEVDAIENLIREIDGRSILGPELSTIVGRYCYWIQPSHQDGLDDDDWTEYQELQALKEEYRDEDHAREMAQESALSLELTGSWTPGETPTADGFVILLSTGGPALRIVGELNQYQEPDRAWLEYQDWGTPWTEYHGDNSDQDALLTFCSCFYFGE